MKKLLILLLLSSLTFAECVGVPSNYHNCQGTVTYPGGNKYIGEYQDGLRNGQGTLIYPDGAKYIGEYQDDKKNGQGTLTAANGDKYIGT